LKGGGTKRKPGVMVRRGQRGGGVKVQLFVVFVRKTGGVWGGERGEKKTTNGKRKEKKQDTIRGRYKESGVKNEKG